MTPEQLAGIAEREKALPPGEWAYRQSRGDIVRNDSWGYGNVVADLLESDYSSESDDIHGEFIAHARQDVPALLVHIDELQAELDQLRAIFKCDLLEDSEALRLAYEKGGDDALRAGKRLAALGDTPDIMIGPGY